MLNRRIIYFFLLSHVFPSGSKTTFQHPSFLRKLVSLTQVQNNQSIDGIHMPMEVNQEDFKCKYKCMTANEVAPKFVSRIQARFIDQGTNDSVKDGEMEAPAAKYSFFNLLSDDEEGEDDDHEDNGGDESVKEDELDIDDFNFFDPEDVKNVDKLEGTKDESLLKQYHRQRLRMHNFLFPLLLAYKLKFFTVIPLLLGSLVLLVGTTGVAGFFFALFAAALAIHPKAQEH